MLLRRRTTELGRRLLHEWTARPQAALSAIRNSTREEHELPPLPPGTFNNADGYPSQASPAALRRSFHDLRNPNFLTDWNISRDLRIFSQHPQQYQQPQRCGISTSVQCQAGEGEEEPVRSPLSQAPGPLVGSGGHKMGVSPTRTAQAVLTGIRQSPQKLNLVAEMVRGMRVEDALTQMAVSVKRAAKTVSKVVHSAQANAVHNFGLEKDRLVVSEAFVGKDKYLKRMRPHGKGKAGKMEHKRARLTVIVKEMSEEQETDLARLRVFRMRGTRMTRAQARLVPHRVLATQWSRQRPPAATSTSSDGAEQMVKEGL
ncbi:unnamed protein product [Calypogeia fissa]